MLTRALLGYMAVASSSAALKYTTRLTLSPTACLRGSLSSSSPSIIALVGLASCQELRSWPMDPPTWVFSISAWVLRYVASLFHLLPCLPKFVALVLCGRKICPIALGEKHERVRLG